MKHFLVFFCYWVILFFTFFDSLLGNCTFTAIVSAMKLIRYICYLGILFLILQNTKGILVKKWGGGFYALFLYFLLVGILSIPGFVHYGLGGFMHYKQFFVLLLIVNAFYYYPKLTGKTFDSLITRFVYIGSIFSIINLACFFVRPSFVNIVFVDRFSAGYPTVDVVPLAFCLMSCLLYENLKMNKIIRLICSVILLISLLTQFSGSGTVFMILILLSVFLYCIKVFKKKKKNVVISNFRMFLVSIFLISFSCISYLLNEFPSVIESSLPVLENRLLTLAGKSDESTLGINTMEMRKDQYKKSIKYYGDNLIIGTGYGPVTIEESKRDKAEYIFIENQYTHNIIVIGYIGSILFIFFILNNTYKSFRCNDELSYKTLYVLSGVMYMLGSNNICTLDIIQSFVPFCLYWAMRESRLDSYKLKYVNSCL